MFTTLRNTNPQRRNVASGGPESRNRNREAPSSGTRSRPPSRPSVYETTPPLPKMIRPATIKILVSLPHCSTLIILQLRFGSSSSSPTALIVSSSPAISTLRIVSSSPMISTLRIVSISSTPIRTSPANITTDTTAGKDMATATTMAMVTTIAGSNLPKIPLPPSSRDL